MAVLMLLAAAILSASVSGAPAGSIHRAPTTLRLVAYYAGWDRYCSLCLPLSRAPFGRLSALIYAFASIQNDSCAFSDISGALQDFEIIRHARKRHSHLKVLLSLGGGDAAGSYASAVSTARRTTTLVRSCVRLIRHSHPGVFDGIDVDWEGPENGTQRAQYTRLIHDFRRALGRSAPLTTAVVPSFDIDWRSVLPDLSWVNLMTYDIHTPSGDRVTDFLAPLKADPRDPDTSRASSVESAVRAMVGKRRVPPDKIMLGLPFYGRGYAGVKSRNHGLYQRYQGTTSFGTIGPGAFAYADLERNYSGRNGYRLYGPNAYSKEVWLYKSQSGAGVFISFDSRRTVAAKAAYIRAAGLGGAMIWELGDDTGGSGDSLTQALYTALHKRS